MPLKEHIEFTTARGISLSMIDQGLYSINNFLLNIFLARTISPAAYGEFAVVFSLFLFISGFQNALIIEPMSVIGPGKYFGNYKKYFTLLSGFSISLTLVVSVLMIIGTSLFAFNNIRQLLYSMSVIMPLLLHFWFVRRFCYVIQRPGNALLGTTLYTFILLISMFTLIKLELLSGLTAFLLMGISGFFGSVISIFVINSYLTNELEGRKILYKNVITEHWQYGRWVTGSAIVSWFNSVVFIPFIALFIGYSEAGIFRALQNFILPVQQFLTALGNYLLPGFSKFRNSESVHSLKNRTRRILTIVVSMVFAYSLILFLAKTPLIRFVFFDDNYLQYSWLIMYLGFALIIDSASQILSITLRALQKPKSIFWSQLGGMIFFFVSGIVLIQSFQLHGVGLTQIIVSSVQLIFILYFYVNSKSG